MFYTSDKVVWHQNISNERQIQPTADVLHGRKGFVEISPPR